MLEALDIQVKGIVQGVGFRPFVYRLAKRHLVNGWVLNGADGVHIHAEGEEQLVDEFVLAISDEAPAAAQVTEIEMREVPLEGFDSFEIRMSDEATSGERTLVSPDLATCDDCARELFDPTDRRFRYPFINCTNCGPRFTIIDDLPYDRAATSMRPFEMCDQCAAEYADPADRRFHAQPDACFTCGPSVSWKIGEGEPHEAHTREETDAIFAEAVEMLLAGKILAVKGLGGFHLVCDANNADAVARLRHRKRRPGKAFAVMCERLDDVRAICQVGDAERRLLEGSTRPIVLCRKLPGVPTPAGVADDLSELGVMLPYTPVQHLLLHDFAMASAKIDASCASDSREGLTQRTAPRKEGVGHEAGVSGATIPMLVMTSGNLHDEPIVTDDEEAYVKLAGIADAFLGNNRRILARFDDSVVRVLQTAAGEAIQFIRRARGYAPLPIDAAAAPSASDGGSKADACTEAGTDLPLRSDAQEASSPSSADQASSSDSADSAGRQAILAVGPEQKNTFTLMRADGKAFVSQHIGDVEDAETFDAWLAAKDRYEHLFDLAPHALACDLHPEYLTSKWAREQAGQRSLPLAEVQHHHAHIVSVMAEHGLEGPVCGIAFDGTGYGPDCAIWGGEVLLTNRQAYERFANFAYVPMPGGQACVKHPLRMAYGVLWEYDLLDHPGAAAALQALGAEQTQVCEAMIEGGLNTPYTSSVGRLFDAASALLGICTQPSYEGEPAILLEAALHDELADGADGAGMSQGASGSEQDADRTVSERYAPAVVKNTATAESTAQDTSVALFDAEPTFRALLDDVAAGVPTPIIARRFHDAIGDAIVMAAQLVAGAYGITTVVLSGGVFMNRYVVQRALDQLQAAGFTVAINRDLPPNDGCISLGQAVVGCHF